MVCSRASALGEVSAGPLDGPPAQALANASAVARAPPHPAAPFTRLDGEVLGRPASTDEARAYLRRLSEAGTHTVCTAVSLIYGDCEPGGEPHEHTFSEETRVTFRALTDEDIETYVASGEPLDAAGGYAIQGLGSAFVSRIEGDYQTVVGFPASRFCSELDTQRLSAWVAAAARAEAPAPVSIAATEEAPVVSDECLDEDECGLPSD